jgi:uncharacterized surface protein with fasciclin (FAS1) repeats
MIRKTIAGLAAGAALAAPLALAAPAQASTPPTILETVSSVDRFTSTENAGGLDRFRWDQRNWYDFDILTAAVVANGELAGAVTDPATAVTLFAPNDRAFQLLAFDLTKKWSSTEQGTLNLILGAINNDPKALTPILKKHVVAGKNTLADVVPLIGTPIPTLSGESITVQKPNKFGFIRIDDDSDAFRDPFIINTDIDAGNSVIHSISRVIMPA